MHNFIYLSLLLCYSQIFANPNNAITTWESLASIPNGEKIKIRGFLYQTGDHLWILSPEPNLKTCCVGSQQKKNSQLIVEGEFSVHPHQVIHLEGFFLKNSKTGTHHLVNVQEIDYSNSRFPWTAFCIGCLLVAVCVVIFRHYSLGVT